MLLLRSVVIISTSYLILFGQSAASGAAASAASIAYILALILSNLGLALTPKDWFHRPRFSAALLLGDTTVVLVGLYLTVGCFSQDFLIIYFFTIFLTTATESIAQIAVGAALISGVYGYWLSLTAGHVLGAGEWLRLPFFFIVALFYAYMTEETKQERWRRQQAERESEHLRFLLQLSDTFSQRTGTGQLMRELGSLVEAAFPWLRCSVHLEPSGLNPPDGSAFLIGSHGRSFGALQVATTDGTPLSRDEAQFCKVVAAVTGNAAYAAEQVSAAQEGTRIKQEFLSTLSHELRSPLHVILGNADILADEVRSWPDPLIRESVDRLRASAFRFLDLIEGLLCFTELRAGKGTLFVERVDLRELFEEMSATISDQLAGRPIRFEWSVPSEVPLLHTDRRKLRLIVSGLLSNAAKFTETGFVRLSARRESDGHVEIAVQDSGIGIAAKDLESIFEEFRQVDGTLKRRFAGLGLGLALAHELVAALDGHLEVDSQVNDGSTFRVRLPLTGRQDAPFAPLAPAFGNPTLIRAT